MFRNFTRMAWFLALMAVILVVGDVAHARATAAAASVAFGDDDDKKGKRGRGQERRDDRQDRDDDRESRRQEQRGDWNSRRQQRDSDRESRRQQQWSDSNSRRQQWESDRRSRRQQQWSDSNSRRQQWQSDRRDRNRDYRRYDNDRRTVYIQPQYFWNNNWNRGNGNWQNHRRFDRQQRRFLKEERKSQRRSERYQRRYSQNYYDGQYNGYYDNGYAGYDNSGSKDQILRMLMGSVLGGGGFDPGSLIAGSSYLGGVPNGFGYNTPNYVYRQPSMPHYTNSQSNYDDQPAYYDAGNESAGGGLLNSLPIAEIIQQYAGNNEFVSQLVGSFLSQGYDQGFLAGQTAREHGYENASYNDPYAYQNGPGETYSSTLGENRRYLSEGYDLGYRDALNGNAEYDEQPVGNSDLVSALLNSVLSGV